MVSIKEQIQYMAEYCVRVENQLSIHKIDFRGINTNRPGNNVIDITTSHLLEIIYIFTF